MKGLGPCCVCDLSSSGARAKSIAVRLKWDNDTTRSLFRKALDWKNEKFLASECRAPKPAFFSLVGTISRGRDTKCNLRSEPSGGRTHFQPSGPGDTKTRGREIQVLLLVLFSKEGSFFSLFRHRDSDGCGYPGDPGTEHRVHSRGAGVGLPHRHTQLLPGSGSARSVQ